MDEKNETQNMDKTSESKYEEKIKLGIVLALSLGAILLIMLAVYLYNLFFPKVILDEKPIIYLYPTEDTRCKCYIKK